MFNFLEKRDISKKAMEWLPYFKQFGLTKKHFFLEKDKLRERFNGKEPLDEDVIWSFFEAVKNSRISIDKWHSISWEQVKFLQDEKKFKEAKFLTNAITLSQFKSSGVVKGVQILTAKDSCESCRAQAKNNFSLTKAEKFGILPNKECTHPKGCRCTYIPVLE